ncbi:RagB/SusD family nutrient uptake outer membrane protein [Capnocytophaga sp.]|uniref:RagB/SusD family nutrient uptake outer membrane protein n=1 Tax=Capnocytophaga sp. TaxID=44737 RepID=UPI0026DD7243|nr:RagB/SusD family nutrient uptake outer membrane protein [Capnocytophaga sp.]MDO5106196.1 RagB/SusD family nutrient uptake outer membrane protein [Capnocytophaga sp.]
MKKTIYIKLVIALALLTNIGCTESFDDYNRDPYALNDDFKKADWLYLKAFFPQMQQSIYYNNSKGNWEFQIAQNLNADLFSGYLTPPTPFNSDRNNINYHMMEGWNEFAFGMYNNNIMKPWLNVKAQTLDKGEFLDVYGVALILKVAGMHKSTDLYGPIPYSKYGQGGTTTPYDSQEAIYKQFFTELDEAFTYLDGHLKGANSSINRLGSDDLIYGGDYKKWLKWANSLRLRLAIRISKVNPVLAQQEAEKAVQNEYGVFEINGHNSVVPTTNMGHPLIVIANDYTDSRMSADMESILTGLNDPRLHEYFSVATDSDASIKGKYKGIRQGINMVSKNLRVNYSTLGARYDMSKRNSTPVILMTAAEVYFLRAEGALRGWAMGDTPENLYKAGIEISMGQWDVTGANTYIADATSKPADYTDPKNTQYNAPAASKITVKWDNAASNEVKLEKIITQKWIAMFPDGAEAWAEFRRTGYPKLFPIVENYSAGEIDSNIMIRRLRFPQNERNGSNKEEVTKAVQFLKGADSPGTRLWWDTGSANF